MIVECAGCSTRFRLADDKIRPSGTKVRCSRCGVSFVVKPPMQAPPPLPPLDEPSVHEMETQVAQVPDDLLAGLRAAPAQDETTRITQVPADLLAELRDGLRPPPPPPPTAGWELPPPLPPAPPPLPAAPPPLPAPAAPSADRGTNLSAGPDLFADLDFGDTRSPPAPSIKLPLPPPVEDDPLAILGPAPALPPLGTGAVERFAPAPQSLVGPPRAVESPRGLELDMGGWVPPAAAPAAAAPSGPTGFDRNASGLELATERWTAQPAPPPSVPAAAPTVGAPQRAAAPEPQLELAEPAVRKVATIGRTRPPVPRQAPVERQRTRPVLGLISGVAVLLTALAGFVVARNGGSLDLGSSEILAAFGIGSATGPAGTTELRIEELATGRYPTAGGDLFFVRGEIESHAAEARGPAIRVVAELRDGERVVARGEAFAGGLPSPEEVHALHDAEEATALAQRRGAGWSRTLEPGARAPFLVVLGAVPADAEALRLVVTAAPAPVPAAPALPAVAADR